MIRIYLENVDGRSVFKSTGRQAQNYSLFGVFSSSFFLGLPF
jgi:hypothetical protein